ncbi:MAG: hypothetical protein HY655_00505, partial [Acidobacteria bacterium]|nr:hypothetical protein [Acidobacteriota bacterium]
MLSKRIIACLDVRDGAVVKGVNFEGLRAAGDPAALALAGGGVHTCALTADAGLRCWGANASGQLGDGTTDQRLAPVDISGLDSGVVAVSAGNAHTCALTTTGRVQCWGQN